MSPITLIAFDNEMQKIAASLSVPQLVSQEAKGLKRGWDIARKDKSTRRLLGRDNRPAFRAREAAAKASKGRSEDTTNVARVRHPASTSNPSAASVKPMLKRLGMGLGMGGSAAVGAKMEHQHNINKEDANARPVSASV